MAVYDCPECGGTVSDTAEVCPHCGWRVDAEELWAEEKDRAAEEDAADDEDKQNRQGRAVFILLLGLGLVAFGLAKSNVTEEERQGRIALILIGVLIAIGGLGLISGHTLKHLTASITPLMIVMKLRLSPTSYSDRSGSTEPTRIGPPSIIDWGCRK